MIIPEPITIDKKSEQPIIAQLGEIKTNKEGIALNA
jgi:hypothetical protein